MRQEIRKILLLRIKPPVRRGSERLELSHHIPFLQSTDSDMEHFGKLFWLILIHMDIIPYKMMLFYILGYSFFLLCKSNN